MKAWVLGAVILFTVCVAGCGGNSTTVAVTITGPSLATTGFPVPVSGSVQLAATVSGITAQSVYWQVCLPPSVTGAQPTNCTPGVSSSQCDIPSVTAPLTGYGTLTPNGLYTAPAVVPSTNTLFAVATSCVDHTAFGTFQIIIKSGFSVTITPTTAIVGTGQTYQFTATVRGPGTSGVNWAVCQSSSSASGLSCGVSGLGTISSSGAYTAPGTPPTGAVTIQATLVADPTQTATATVTVSAATAPTIAAIEPTVAAAGSAQLDVYLGGTNFLSTEEVFVGPNGQTPVAVPTTLISTNLIRATIPAAQLAQAGSVDLTVQTADGSLTAPVAQTLTLFATRPALIASLPDSVSQSIGGTTGANVTLTGGFFSNATTNQTTPTFNGASVNSWTVTSSRQLSISLPGSALAVPGLYPIVLQNSGVSSVAGLNLAVTPDPTSISAGPSGSVTVGANPTAIAIDKADGYAVVANTGDNSVSIVALQSNPASDSVVRTISVGNQPTGVAVDDQLFDPVALVVNSADQTVTAIDLKTFATSTPLSVSIGTGANAAVPVAVGINPTTAQPVPGVSIVHRALVAYKSSSQAAILDVSDASGTPSVTLVQTIGGTSLLPFSTGPNPQVAIDPRLNWAIVTPGGAGAISIVDLGRDAVPGVDVGRAPQIIAGLNVSTTVQGIGVDSETHQVLLSDPVLGTLSTFSPLDDSVSTVTCNVSPCTGGVFNATGYGAAAVNPLDNIGVAVSSGNAAVLNLESGVVLKVLSGLVSSTATQAVAVDPVLNQAIVVNSGANSVSILSLGGVLDPMQIAEVSPTTTFTSAAAVPLTVTGSFTSNSVIRLDQQALPTATADCSGTVCNQLTTSVPVSMLGAAARYTLDVQDTSTNAVSNVEDFTVVQPIPVGSAPVGVAIDTDRDLAVVTNSGDGTASLVSLAQGVDSPQSLGPVGELPYSPVSVGSAPAGVAVLSRLGLALVANSGSNNATAIDETGTNPPSTIVLCSSNCVGPTGVAINTDTATAVIASPDYGTSFTAGALSTFSLSPLASAATSFVSVDQGAIAAAVDPYLNYAAVATASQASSVDIIDLATDQKIGGITGSLQNPSGIIFDPINQVFLTADSLQNTVSIIDPTTFIPTQVPVGIAPTSLDYNYQTSTLVTLNGPSNTMSVMAYVCPPTGSAPTCSAPRVRSVLALGGAQTSTPVLGPNAVAIDPKLNLAAVVDSDNNRLLLIPLPR